MKIELNLLNWSQCNVQSLYAWPCVTPFDPHVAYMCLDTSTSIFHVTYTQFRIICKCVVRSAHNNFMRTKCQKKKNIQNNNLITVVHIFIFIFLLLLFDTWPPAFLNNILFIWHQWWWFLSILICKLISLVILHSALVVKHKAFGSNHIPTKRFAWTDSYHIVVVNLATTEKKNAKYSVQSHSQSIRMFIVHEYQWIGNFHEIKNCKCE